MTLCNNSPDRGGVDPPSIRHPGKALGKPWAAAAHGGGLLGGQAGWGLSSNGAVFACVYVRI